MDLVCPTCGEDGYGPDWCSDDFHYPQDPPILTEPSSNNSERSDVETSQTVSDTASNTQSVGNSEIAFDTSYPVPKRYAHHGKRRRSITKELFRCPYTDMISRTPLVCGHLLWRNKITELRSHLLEHLKVEDVEKMSDSQVQAWYMDAKRIFLEGIPEDDEDETEESELTEDV